MEVTGTHMITKKNRLKLPILLGLSLLFAQGCGGGGTGEEPLVQGPGGGGGTVVGVGTAQLSWDAPDSNSDGTPLTDFVRYRVYIGQTTPVSRDSGSWITVEDITSYTFSELTPGVYYFAVSAVNIQGAESDLSNEVERIVL